MKKLHYLLVFVLVLIGFQVSVNAEGWGDNGSGGTDNDHGDCGPNCTGFTYSIEPGGYGYGIRLSLVDEKGNRIEGTKSFDLIKFLRSNVSPIYSVKSKPNRYEVVNGNGVSFTRGYDGYLGKDLPRFINEGKDSYIRIRDYLRNNYLGYNTVNVGGTNELLGYLGASYDQFINDKKCNRNIYLAVETIAIFLSSSSKTYYIGTVSEFANWVYHNSNNLANLHGTFRDGTWPLSLYANSDLAGLSKVAWFSRNSAIFSDMNKKVNGLIPGYGIFLFYLNDIWGCGPAEPEPEIPKCDFNLDVKIPQNCSESGNVGQIKDIEDWDCIFTSTLAGQKAGNDKISNHFFQWENNYCATYCREVVRMDYPGNDMTVLAGTHFVLGSELISNGPTNFALPKLSPIRFTSTSECRVTKNKDNRTDTNINYAKFKTDFQNADKKVKDAWDKLQVAIKQDWANENAEKGNDSGCGCVTANGQTSCPEPYYYPKKVSYVYNAGESAKDVTPEKFCSKPSAKTTSARTAYENAVNDRANILRQIKDCNNFVMKNEMFNPIVDFEYKEPFYGKQIKDLAKTVKIDTTTDYYSSDGGVTHSIKEDNVDFKKSTTLKNHNDFVTTSKSNGKTTTISSWTCDTEGQPCKMNQTTYPNNLWLKQWTTKIYDYKLPEGLYNYVLKTSGESYSNFSEIGVSKNSVSAIIPYSNLPVHFSTAEGKYDYNINFRTLGVEGTKSHKFDYYVFKGGKVGQSFGESSDIYDLIMSKPNLSSQLRHNGGNDYLGNEMAKQLKNENLLNDFINSDCAQRHNCKVSDNNITCTKYKKDSENWDIYTPGWQTDAAYMTYEQLASCIAGNATTAGETAFSGTTNYSCKYNVENLIMPPESDRDPDSGKGLNLIFRPISLNEPFPSIDADGREPGANWNILGSNGEAVYKIYITNNRKVETNQVYKLDPLYKITLTPGLIKEIRKYNDQQDSKTTTYYDKKSGRIEGRAGYTDFELTCDKESKNCKSKFIRETISGYNFHKFFTGCGISGKDAGLKCSTGDAW